MEYVSIYVPELHREAFSRILCTGFLGCFNCIVFKRFRGFHSYKNVKRSCTTIMDQSTVLVMTISFKYFRNCHRVLSWFIPQPGSLDYVAYFHGHISGGYPPPYGVVFYN